MNWEEYYRIAMPRHKLLARKLVKEEKIKRFNGIEYIIQVGDWMCKNINDDHVWGCGDDVFHKLYCKEGVSSTKHKEKVKNGEKQK